MPCGGRSVTGTPWQWLCDGDRGLVAVRHGPDDVLRSPGRVAAEEDAGARRLAWSSRRPPACPICRTRCRGRARSRGTRSPGRWRESRRRPGGRSVSITLEFLRVGVPFQALELHAGELAVLDHEALGRVIDDDLDAFFLGVLQFPGRGLEVAARAARHHLDVFAAQPARRAAAIHGGVADADDQNLLADRIDVAEGDRLQPVDADVDAIGIVAAGDLEILAARRAAADEDRVEALRRAAPSCC